MREAFRRLLAALLLLLLLPLAPAAQEPPREPFLRIETGMHAAPVRRVLALPDAQGLVTVSEDKTIRVWSLDGALLRTLRVPVARGSDGALYAAALSPDGRLLAVGGNVGGSWAGRSLIYLISVESGRPFRRPLQTPPGTLVAALAFSPDGTQLAIGLAGAENSVTLVDLAATRVLARDRDYRDRITGLAFHAGGALAVAALDGEVRLYPPGLAGAPRRVRLPEGGQPGDLAFSPDGRLLAVGVANRPQLRLFDARSLEPRGTPPLGPELSRGAFHLHAVAWSTGPGGPRLHAAGHVADRDGTFLVLQWANTTQAPVARAAVARDTVTHLAPVPGHGIAFAAADPAFGLLGPGLQPRMAHRADNADFRFVGFGTFGVSPDGRAVEFGMDRGGRNLHRFSLADRRMTQLPEPARVQRPALALPITDWESGPAPRLGGRVLALDPGELTRSVSVAPDQTGFVLGTDTHLRPFTASGEALPAVEMPATVWGVAHAAAAPLLVAALGDGTLRWYHLREGVAPRLLATLFPHRDGRRWVMWTPEGFFDHADEGGQELVGYTLNAGPAALAEWRSFAQLYRVFYAPGLVSGRLAGTGETAIAARLASLGDVRDLLAQPPEITFTSVCWDDPQGQGEQCAPLDRAPPGATRGLVRIVEAAAEGGDAGGGAGGGGGLTLPAGVLAVRVTATIADRGGGIGMVDLFLNERNAGRAADSRGLARIEVGDPASRPPGPAAQGASPAPLVAPPTQATGTGVDTGLRRLVRHVALDPGANRIAIRAYGATNQVYGKSALLELTTAPVREERPTLHILAIGVDDYRFPDSGLRPLGFAAADARAVADAVRRRVAPDYGAVRVISLLDDQATRARIEATLEGLAEDAKPQDVVLVYLAGHGIVEGNSYRFVPFLPPDTAPDALGAQMLPDTRLLELWSRLRARNSLLLIDTCHAGAFSLDFAGRLAHEAGRYVLAAAAPLEEALDNANGRNGPFAVAVLEALEGQAGVRTGDRVSQFTIGWHVHARVPELARRASPTHRQRAEFRLGALGGQLLPFPIARLP